MRAAESGKSLAGGWPKGTGSMLTPRLSLESFTVSPVCGSCRGLALLSPFRGSLLLCETEPECQLGRQAEPRALLGHRCSRGSSG